MFNRCLTGVGQVLDRCLAGALTFSLFRWLVSPVDSGAVHRLGAAAQLRVGVSLGFGGRLFSVGIRVVLSPAHWVEGLGSDGETLTGGGQTVLRGRHRHETHPKMFSRICPVCCHSNIFTNPGWTNGKYNCTSLTNHTILWNMIDCYD